jgi:hypothetical protein
MSDYRVSFFKDLVSSDGHRFRCLQQEIDIRNSDSSAEAAESASRTFEALHGLPDWKLRADWREVVATGTDGGEASLPLAQVRYRSGNARQTRAVR